MVAECGLLIALAFVFSYVESMIPMPIPIPGIKLGLANLVQVVGLYTIGVWKTAAISMVRIVLVGCTFGNPASMMYSLGGGILSLLVMIVAKRYGGFSSIGVSVLGGVFHNIGQLFVAAWVLQTAGVFSYFPVLLAAGTVTGAVIGYLGGTVTERITPMRK